MKKCSPLGLLILLVLPVFYGCDSESDNTPSLPIYPLSEGNSWTYESRIYSYGIDDTPRIYKLEMKAYTIDGHKGFSGQEYVKGWPISLLNNDDKGNCIESLFINDKLVHQTLLYKKDVKKGDKWIRKTAVYINDDYSQCRIQDREITCISVDTLISTPKGNFHCIGLKYSPTPDDTMFEFLSENVGRVFYQHYEKIYGKDKLHDDLTLADYTLK